MDGRRSERKIPRYQQDENRFVNFAYQKETKRKIEEKKKRNERRIKEEKIEYRSQKIHEITDHYNNNSSGVVDENQSQSFIIVIS